MLGQYTKDINSLTNSYRPIPRLIQIKDWNIVKNR